MGEREERNDGKEGVEADFSEEDDIQAEYPYPVREIKIEQGINDEGGGVEIHVRMDGVSPEKIMEIVLTLMEKINGEKKEEIKGMEVC